MEQNTTNKPLRRVGTLTLGVCLIAAGVLFLLARFLPGLPWLVIWQVLPAAGLILLGCEVLYYSARPGACRCDFGSVVLCLLLFSIGPDDYISYSLNRMLDTGVGVAMSLLINGLLPRERLDAWQEKLGALRNRSEAGR